ncbi:Uncharacterised protein [Shigella sonnei]|nr:Uncharacterised protein [Shigella sonnei]CSS62457.1 Uncharacterised protein [Shigella sonnei]SJA71127.1 Uncharacterised protein [Shigella sonnei]SWT26199.1 Uncharacterised protein [Klebsiella pneumoniae]
MADAVSPQTFFVRKQFAFDSPLRPRACTHTVPFFIGRRTALHTTTTEAFCWRNLAENICWYRLPATIELIHIVERQQRPYAVSTNGSLVMIITVTDNQVTMLNTHP